MKKILLLLLFLSLSFSGCTKEDDNPRVPPITEQNTFSCYVEGELFLPKNHGGFYNLYGYLISILEDNSWIITLSNGKITLYLFIKEVNRTGFYEVSGSDGNQFFVQDSATAVEMRDEVADVEYISLNNASKIEVLHFVPNEELMLQFNEITLIAVDDPENKIILSEGKLNINKETLNKE